MHTKLKFLIPALFAIFLAGKLHAQDSFVQDVSYPYLQRLIDTAKKYYPEVRVRATQTEIARTTYHQTQLSWFDVITPSYLYNPTRSTNLITPTAFNSYQLAITVNIGTIIEKPYLIHNAKQAVKVASLQADEYNQTIEAQVKRLYFAYIGAKAELRLRNRSVVDATTTVEQLKHQFEKNEKVLTEYNSALVIYYTQADYQIQSEVAVFNAKASLEEIVGKKLEDIK